VGSTRGAESQLLVGAILHVLYAEPDKTLAGVAAFLSDPKRPIESTLKAMMTTPHLGHAGPHSVVASTARELLNKSDNERSGVLSTAMSFLGLYRDPVVAEVTRKCDWRITDLIADDRPATLYLVVPPSDISRTKPLIRLVLNQIGRRLTEDLHARNRRHRVLLMLDEFPALGRLDFFESALAFMAGYGLKSFLIAVVEPDREGLWREQFDPRQLPRPRELRDQRRAHRQAGVRRPRHRDRDEGNEELCRASAFALARPPDGLPI
jgi:type IV secretion system protein VirD4